MAHRDADELADVRIARVVFILHRSPFARKIHLGERGHANQQHGKKQGNGKLAGTNETHKYLQGCLEFYQSGGACRCAEQRKLLRDLTRADARPASPKVRAQRRKRLHNQR